MKFSHFTASFVLFAVLIGLLIGFYNGLVDNYGIVPGDVKTVGHNRTLDGGNRTVTGNIVEQFEAMQLLSGIERISEGFSRLQRLTAVDLVGGLLMAALGTLQVLLGVIILPYELVNIIALFYGGDAPIGIVGGIAAMVVVYAGFIFLSIKVGRDL